MLGLNAAVENHIRKHQKKPTVAIPSCSTLWARINVCSAGRFGDPSHPRKEREPQATNVADGAAAARAPGPGLVARRLRRFHLEIGEGAAATGKGDTVLLAPAVLFKLRFLGKRSGEAPLALCATAGPAGVIHLDSVGFRQFQEGHGLVRLDRPVALDEVDTVPRLRQRQRLRHTLASPRDPAGSETLAMKLGLIKAELLEDPPYLRGEGLRPAQENVPLIEVGDQRMDHRLVESPGEAGPGFASPGPGGGQGDGNAATGMPGRDELELLAENDVR